MSSTRNVAGQVKDQAWLRNGETDPASWPGSVLRGCSRATADASIVKNADHMKVPCNIYGMFRVFTHDICLRREIVAVGGSGEGEANRGGTSPVVLWLSLNLIDILCEGGRLISIRNTIKFYFETLFVTSSRRVEGKRFIP